MSQYIYLSSGIEMLAYFHFSLYVYGICATFLQLLLHHISMQMSLSGIHLSVYSGFNIFQFLHLVHASHP